MNPVRIRPSAAVLASLAAGLVALATPALASEMAPPDGGGYVPALAAVPPPGTEFTPSAAVPAPVGTLTHAVVLGGMPGWQIALIAIGAALLAAAAAVLLDRAWAARRPPDNSIRPAASSRFGQPEEDREFPYGRAETISDDLIGTADLAVPRTRNPAR